VDEHQSPAAYALLDQAPAEARHEQLTPRHDTVLTFGQAPDRLRRPLTRRPIRFATYVVANLMVVGTRFGHESTLAAASMRVAREMKRLLGGCRKNGNAVSIARQ
jgi:hypothetical protein